MDTQLTRSVGIGAGAAGIAGLGVAGTAIHTMRRGDGKLNEALTAEGRIDGLHETIWRAEDDLDEMLDNVDYNRATIAMEECDYDESELQKMYGELRDEGAAYQAEHDRIAESCHAKIDELRNTANDARTASQDLYRSAGKAGKIAAAVLGVAAIGGIAAWAMSARD